MGRLHCILLSSPETERQKAFYAEKLGLAASAAAPGWTRFAMRGAALALRPTGSGEAARIELAIVASPLEARMAAVTARGVEFEGAIETLPDCRMATLRDPEGNWVQLVDPIGDAEQGRWPRLSHAIVNAADFTRTVSFYRNVIGLRVSTEEEGWVEFETGETALAVHDRERADGLLLRPEQRITFALEDEDFEAWAAELRGRGVTFATAPMEQELGVQAEVEDADGWFVVLHSPAPEEPHEADLAEEFEDEESGARTQVIRRPGESMTENVKKRTTPAKQARRAAERAGARSPDGTSRSSESERTPLPPLPRAPRPGGFAPRPAPPGGFAPRPSGPAGPGGFAPRPPRPGGFAPRPGGPSRPPRPSGPGGPSRPPGPAGPPRRGPDEK